MKRFLYDTNVFLYARGTEHRYRAPCRAILRAASEGSIGGELTTELIQEHAHYLVRRGVERATIRDECSGFSRFPVLPVTLADMRIAADLFVLHPRLQMRDAVHAATAVNNGIHLIVSADRGFDDVPGFVRLDPMNALDVLLRAGP